MSTHKFDVLVVCSPARCSSCWILHCCCDIQDQRSKHFGIKACCPAPLLLCRTSLKLAFCIADAFDDLVKEAVHTANAAAQSRADYAATVIAAELAEARGGTVASKRGKRRSTSPKTLKRLAWAAEEHLIQHRIFSKVRVQCNLS